MKETSRSIEVDLGKIEKLNTVGLRAMYERVFGRATHSRDRDYLRRRLRARLGGLAKKLRARHPKRSDRADDRDARLPPVGSLLRRVHQGSSHEVKVLEDGFEYAGETYGSLSTIAKIITGTTWNGFGFFRRALTEAQT